MPFTQTFEGDKRDRCLGDKLRAEADGILAWMVRGCLDWQKQGLGEPQDVVTATAQYRLEEDIVGQFITDCCVVGREYTARASHLRQSFEQWLTTQDSR